MEISVSIAEQWAEPAIVDGLIAIVELAVKASAFIVALGALVLATWLAFIRIGERRPGPGGNLRKEARLAIILV